ncbi:integrin alpha-11-like, partial [Anarrhichthys ocellatus]|uniref:integrin alpha-11-like n=1 Tax=Anarrhichthys ocellatus TaxID=433405 RepID=UPI0012EE643D
SIPLSCFVYCLTGCETFMDIVIVLDGSNSIYPWYEVRDFLITILQKFYIGPGQTQVGVVQYGSTVVHEFGLGEYQTVEEVVEAARGIDQRGGEETRTALGINVARSDAFKRGGRPGAQKVMIVITDGESHDSPQLVQAVADSERDNVTMYAIAVLGYYNRRGINPEAFLKEIKFIASDPDEKHFFNVSDESALKDIADALGERIFSLEGTSSQGRGFGLQMAQAGFSSHLVKDGILLGAVGAYDWNGAVLKETKHGKVVPPKSSYKDEFPEELKNHGAYLGYSVGSLISSRGSQLYVAGAPRFNHTGKVIIFSLKNTGNLTILQALLGEQIGSYFGSELLSIDVDDDGQSDVLVVAAPMFYSQGWERGKVYIYTVTPQVSFMLQGALEVSDRSQNSRLGSALAQIPDMNGDGFRELVMGAPLEDDHQGAVYIFYGKDKTIQHQYRQRLSAAGFSAGLQYFGQSLHGVLDVNADGLVDLAVGALGAAVIIWSRGVVRIQAKLIFEPEKVNVFNKDCRRGGKEVTCMSVNVCLSLDARTKTKTKTRTDVGGWDAHANYSYAQTKITKPGLRGPRIFESAQAGLDAMPSSNSSVPLSKALPPSCPVAACGWSPQLPECMEIQNLGIFLVQDVLFRADIWAVTRRGNQLVSITDFSIEQVAGSHCMLPQPRTTDQVTAEDLSHLSQLNLSNSVSLS